MPRAELPKWRCGVPGTPAFFPVSAHTPRLASRRSIARASRRIQGRVVCRDGKADHEVREAMGDKFPKHIYHSIICIGALVAHCDNGHWQVDALGAPHIGDLPEKVRYELFSGGLSYKEFRMSEDNLTQFIAVRGNTKPHLTDLVVSD